MAETTTTTNTSKLEIKDNYDLFRIFATKEVKIYIHESSEDASTNPPSIIYLHTPTIKELYCNDDLVMIFNLLTRNDEKHLKTLKLMFPLKDFNNVAELLLQLYSYYFVFEEYRFLINPVDSLFKLIFKTNERENCDLVLYTDPQDKQLKIAYKYNLKNDDKHKNYYINITSEIWDYISYILRLSCGEKVARPITFSNEMERNFYLAQQKAESRIQALRQKNNEKMAKTASNQDILMKAFLSITYAFPSITFDFLLNQTMAQIQWLQQYAAKAMSYQVNAQAAAAGNVKKGFKLKSFLE